MLIWWLKQGKDFILKFSISGSFFSEKWFLNLHTMALVSFPSGGCVDKVANNLTNYQGFKYVYFLQYHTMTVIHFTIGEGVCEIVGRISLNHSWWCKHNKVKNKVKNYNEKPRD